MKNFISNYLILLIVGLMLGCQSNDELLPLNPNENMAEEIPLGIVGDENARKASETEYGAFLQVSEEDSRDSENEDRGSGTAKFQLLDNSREVYYELKVANTSEVHEAQIILEKSGESVVKLQLDRQPTETEIGFIGMGTFTEQDLEGPYFGHPLDTLFVAIAKGDAFVKMRSQNSGGDLWGQISKILPNENGIYNTKLSAREVIPANNSRGTGVGHLRYKSDNSELVIKINVANLTDVTASHIHIGKAGSNGPAVVSLRSVSSGFVNGLFYHGIVSSNDLRGILLGGDLEMLREAMRTGNAYINVNTLQFPDGEIRGQL